MRATEFRSVRPTHTIKYRQSLARPIREAAIESRGITVVRLGAVRSPSHLPASWRRTHSVESPVVTRHFQESNRFFSVVMAAGGATQALKNMREEYTCPPANGMTMRRSVLSGSFLAISPNSFQSDKHWNAASRYEKNRNAGVCHQRSGVSCACSRVWRLHSRVK